MCFVVAVGLFVLVVDLLGLVGRFSFARLLVVNNVVVFFVIKYFVGFEFGFVDCCLCCVFAVRC